MANHASHAALPYPIKGARYTILVPYLDADGDPTDPTTPDTEISEDDGAATDTAEEVASPKNSVGMLTLTGAELDCSCASVAAKAASGPKTTIATLYPRVLATVGTGTLSAGSAGGGTLGTLLPYDVTGCFIKTTGGTGGGGTGGANNQVRKIVTYNTGTGAFTVTPDWETTPSTDTTYEVLLPEGVTLGMLRALNPATAGRTVVVDASGLVDANAVKVGPTGSGTAQTARDLGGTLGAAGAGLTAVPWNAAWDAEVQSECDDALQALGFTTTVSGRIDAAVSSRMATFTLPTNFSALLINASGHVSRVTLADTLTTYTGNTVQTGDAFARLGAPAGASVSADIAAVKGDTAATLADTGTDGVVVAAASKTGYALSSAGVQAIWDALSSALTTVGSIGKRLVDYLTGDVYARVGAPAGASIAADIDALPTAAENAAALLDLSNGVETSITPRQALRLILAASAGKLSGAATTTIVIRNVGDSKDRITATVDASGNRTAVTTDGT